MVPLHAERTMLLSTRQQLPRWRSSSGFDFATRRVGGFARDGRLGVARQTARLRSSASTSASVGQSAAGKRASQSTRSASSSNTPASPPSTTNTTTSGTTSTSTTTSPASPSTTTSTSTSAAAPTTAPLAAPLATATTTTSTYLSTRSPAWLQTLGRRALLPLRAYGRAATARPNTTQLLSSLVIYTLGDLISQYIRQPPSSPSSPSPSPNGGGGGQEADPTSSAGAPAGFASNWDAHRTSRALLIGGLASLPAYHYFLWLSALRIPSLSFSASLAIKVIINQLTFAPLINTWFFAAHCLLTSPSHTFNQPRLAAGETWGRCKETVPGTWVMGWKVWPVVTAVNFSVVDVKYRSVVAGAVAVGWQGYLGWVDLRARERGKPGGA
ncbi:MAG: hypothetical protein M1828_003494 [Chrysothrix sp. TS-e1954]|nr:MAG: hypothetical protein M1828_003494 [Chrysothrix sp. TS-e1954]